SPYCSAFTLSHFNSLPCCFLEDHWLGLSKVFALTKGGRGLRSTMRVDLWDFEGGTAFAEYSDFRLGMENEAYKLNVGAYRGNAGDAIRGKYTGI
ncbi:hypothetical protein J4Q44_G00384630, partial [Coregonus suidteri]